MKSIFKYIFIVLLICTPQMLGAQTGAAYGAYTPYSIYGVGELNKEGTSFTKSMGGIGIATRNKRFLNIVNPAAVTAMDSLSFMADFGVNGNNEIYSQKIDGSKLRSANNTFNITNFVISFPIYRSSAMMLGIMPFSNVGYNFTSTVTNPEVIGNTGNISYNSYGEGGIYQLFASGGVTFWKRLSLGAEFIYYFGNIDKVSNQIYANSSTRSINSGSTMFLTGTTGKFGLQYEQKLGNNISLTVGATYRLRTSLKGYSDTYSYAVLSSVTDTLSQNSDTLGVNTKAYFADEVGVGVSLKKSDRWSVEFNWLRSGWDRSGFDAIDGLAVRPKGTEFSATASNSYRAGFEFVPNRNDIRYYMRRCSYRGGVYYDEAYYKFDGNMVTSMGITMGITFPVFVYYNGISLGMDIGQRSSLRNNMIRERYVNFSIGINIHDIWFQKHRYE